jgi:putative DNA primase/helicase
VSTEAIAARHLYGKSFVFKPTHKTWVRANHKPIVADTDDGIWRRLSLVPFERNFAPHERDLNLEAKLMAEAPGILAWMVRGYAEYMRRGLVPCSRVAAASSAYRKESDLLGQWIEDEADTAAGHEVPQGIAYATYQSWCHGQGLRAVAKKSFTRGLTERGIRERQRSTGARERLYVGMRLKSDFLHAQDAQD